MHRGLIAAALVAGPAAQAQSIQDDFQLPPGTPPPAAGPTDSNVPSPTPQPSPQSSPPKIVVPQPAPTSAPTARPTPSPAPRVAPSAPRPAPASAPAATPVASPAPTEAAPAPEIAASAPPSEAARPAPAAAAKGFPDWLLWLAAGAGVLLLAFAAFLFGRRSRSAAEPDYADDEPVAAPAPEAPPPVAPPPPLPAPAFPTRPFDLKLEPLRMTMAMINASLTYRLAIENRDERPLGPLRITCDLISAHASLQQAEQLVPDPASGWLSYDFEALPPGESLVINGEVKLPRTEILPIRSGNSPLFVPLARFTVQTVENGVVETVGARVFVIGEEPDQPGAGLKPFRLNDGTRSYSRVGQREVTIAR